MACKPVRRALDEPHPYLVSNNRIRRPHGRQDLDQAKPSVDLAAPHLDPAAHLVAPQLDGFVGSGRKDRTGWDSA